MAKRQLGSLSAAVALAATFTSIAPAQPKVVPDGLTIPQLSAIDDPTFGTGGVTATAGNGLVSKGCERMLGDLQFDVNVLPSTCGFEFNNNTGSSEEALYSVLDGVLQQRTLAVNGNASYAYPGFGSNGDLRAELWTILEARVTITDLNGQFGAYLQAFDGEYRYTLRWLGVGVLDCEAQACVAVFTSDGDRTFSIEPGPNTYRFESPPNSGDFELYVNDILTFSSVEHGVTAPPENRSNHFSFGDGFTAAGNGANADWDFVRVRQVSETRVVGDVNCDGSVGFVDLTVVLSNWGPCPTGPCGTDCPADLDADQTVGFVDLTMLLANWTS